MLHIGRNKYRIFVNSDKELYLLVKQLRDNEIKIRYYNPIDSTFLDYFRIQSKYTYHSLIKTLTLEAADYLTEPKGVRALF